MAELKVDNVPESLIERLNQRAQVQGLSISALVVAELTESLRRPSRIEVLDRIASQPPTRLKKNEVAQAVRAERDAR